MNRRIALGGVLTLISASSFGLSLGPVQGRAVIGQSLALNFPISLSSGETIDRLCASAKVMFGESSVAPDQIQINVIAAASSTATAMVTLRTPVTVSEPYLTVDLQVGCAGRQSRQYLLLTDLKTALTGKLSADPIRSSGDVVVSSAPEQTSIPPSTDSRISVALPRVSAQLPLSQGGVISTAQTGKTQSTRRPPQEKKQLPHLKIDPLEWLNAEMEWSPTLHFSRQVADVSVDSAADLSRRAEAAQIWLTLNKSPEQLLQQWHAFEKNKEELSNLRTQINRFEQEKSDLQVKLSQKHDTKYLNPVVVGLGLSLLVAVLGLGISMTRKRDSGRTSAPWWQPHGLKAQSPGNRWFTWGRKSMTSTVRTSDAVKPGALDINLDTLFKSDAFHRPNHVDAADSIQSTHPPESSDFLHSSLMDNSRSVAAEELFDLQQQVEFFISLGQSQQAANLLISHLSDGDESSPLAYLDLLKLYHQMGDRDKYDELKSRFNSQFNAGVPVFENYSYSRRGLERYGKALSRIQSLWPSRGVLEVIETSLFNKNVGGDGEVFDLEAYRELLLLYGIARYLNSNGGKESEALLHPEVSTIKLSQPTAGLLDTEFPVTNLQPLTAQTREGLKKVQSVFDYPVNGAYQASNTNSHQLVENELDLDLSQAFEIPKSDETFLNPDEAGEAFFKVTLPQSLQHSLEFNLASGEDGKTFTIKKSGIEA